MAAATALTQYARQRAEKAGQQDEEQMRYFEALCLGNTYATTIHALNSALIKLGKLGGAERESIVASPPPCCPIGSGSSSGGGNGKPSSHPRCLEVATRTAAEAMACSRQRPWR